ncbi:MAG: DUF5689 domain-containing protein [Prevotellaceae bacterium]|jgi:hypothetical protein|nr:DUF5689 domain-containing protein [Prevotellaceae bacterium]
MKKFLLILIAVLAIAGCTKYAPIEPDNKPISEAKAIITHSIEELIAEFGSEKGVLSVRTNNGGTGIFSVDTIPSVETYGSEIIIAGRVISDDTQGNCYKTIFIQDLKNTKWHLKISIDASGISSWYPLGQVISLKCNGLAIGKYADMFQLGEPFYNVPSTADPNRGGKIGYEVGRISLPKFITRVERYGTADASALEIDTLTIAEIKQTIITDRSLHSRLIRIENIHFNQKSQGSALIDSLKIFAPSTYDPARGYNVGFPQSRDIEDGTGDYLSVATSEYSRFCNVRIPAAQYVGTVTAILGWYKDKSGYAGSVQLTIRSLDDLQLYSDTDGEKWKP